MKNEKRKLEFNIIKDAPTDGHKGFGVGTLSLENITPVLIDIEEGEAWIEPQTMHARSKVERGVKYLNDFNEFPQDGAKKYWVVWVAVNRKEEGPYYSGLTGCELYINREKRRGYKSMPQHVNYLDKAMKNQVIVHHMDEKSRKALAELLQSHSAEMWELASEELKNQLLFD